MSYYGSTPPPPPPPFGGYQPSGYGTAPTAAALASWIQRVGASLIDYALFLPFVIMQVVLDPESGTTTASGPPVTEGSGNDLLILLVSVLGLGVWVYNRYYLGGKGQSLGKKALGLTLVSESTGQPIGMGMAFVRDLAHIVDGLICDVGYLFPLWDEKRQTLADKIVSTLVTA